FLFVYCPYHCALCSFPTRRSSDLGSRSRGMAWMRRRKLVMGWPLELSTGAPVGNDLARGERVPAARARSRLLLLRRLGAPVAARSEEHTSELQSRENLVCRLLLEK